MKNGRYRFRLRDDLPPGLQQNDRFPELPAAYSFLKEYDRRIFDSRTDFVRTLGGFRDYLQDVPSGDDAHLRLMGLRTFAGNRVGLSTKTNRELYYGQLEAVPEGSS